MGRHDLLRATIAVAAGVALALCAALFVAGCGDPPVTTSTTQSTAQTQEESTPSSVPSRLAVTQTAQDDVDEVAASNNGFSLDLFKAVRSADENLVCSPYSLTQALAMTMAGARGATQDEMKQTLHISLPYYRLNRAMNALDQNLALGGIFECANSVLGADGAHFQATLRGPCRSILRGAAPAARFG